MTRHHHIMKKNLSEKSVGYKQSVRYMNNHGNLRQSSNRGERGARIDEHQPICRSKNNGTATTAYSVKKEYAAITTHLGLYIESNCYEFAKTIH
jgi:hypothetical protein